MSTGWRISVDTPAQGQTGKGLQTWPLPEFTMRQAAEAGVHFGHQPRAGTQRCNITFMAAVTASTSWT